MPVDYSKWDALELSDDSDIEVHPNVDKKSFIRAKQAQIHQERAHRKQDIETLKYERIINDGLLTRIDSLLNALKAHSSGTGSSDALVFQALIESAGDQEDDMPPAPPAGVRENAKQQPPYSQMMAALVDQVKKKVDETQPANRMEGFIIEVNEHKTHVLDLQQQLLTKLAELEKSEKGKITSSDIHEGFNSSHVFKPSAVPSQSSSTSRSATSTVELLNSPKTTSTSDPDSGAEADTEDAVPSSSSPHRANALGNAFGKILSSDYRASLQYISQNPAVLAERNTDGLLLSAFDAQSASPPNPNVARNCVHQALLLQYCRALGQDGVALFFKRITTKDHNARKVFLDDVNTTYARLRDRAVEMAKEEAEDAENAGVEQIQLHAVNPGQKINISIPDPNDPEDVEARRIFESFPPGLQRALESGELDEVNKVLGRMSVEEAEEVVEKLGDGGMLSMEEGVIDATTEEGKRRVEEIEKEAKVSSGSGGQVLGEMQDDVEMGGEKLSVDQVD
jgi:cell division cycle protein 37